MKSKLFVLTALAMAWSSPFLASAQNVNNAKAESKLKVSAFKKAPDLVFSIYKSTLDINESILAWQKDFKKFTLQQIQSKIQKNEAELIRYFDTAKIKYQIAKTKTVIKFDNTNQMAEIESFDFFLFGSAGGDEFSRLINGVQSNKKYKVQLIVNMNVLYDTNNQDSAGHFIPQKNTIFLSPSIILKQLIGVQTTLMHEMKHYMESMKILNGEPSIARLKFSAAKSNPDLSYGKYLSADELETHLRDIRYLSNEQLISSINKKTEKDLGLNMTTIKDIRQQMLSDKIETITQILNSYKQSLAILTKTASLDDSYWDFERNGKTGLMKVYFSQLSGIYDTMSVDLTGMVPYDIEDKKIIKAETLKVIAWNKEYIKEIESRIQFLEKKITK